MKVGRYLAAGHRDADELTYAEETRPRHAQETVDVGRVAGADLERAVDVGKAVGVAIDEAIDRQGSACRKAGG